LDASGCEALSTHGIDEANSAIDAATVRTKRLGINHPKTMPTCPPETSGKEKVDVTEATTPIIENENAINSISFNWHLQCLTLQLTDSKYVAPKIRA